MLVLTNIDMLVSVLLFFGFCVHALMFSLLPLHYQYQYNWLHEKIRLEMTCHVSGGTLNLTN